MVSPGGLLGGRRAEPATPQLSVPVHAMLRSVWHMFAVTSRRHASLHLADALCGDFSFSCGYAARAVASLMLPVLGSAKAASALFFPDGCFVQC